MDFSAVEKSAEKLENILDNLKALCGPDFIDGTNISWDIIINLIERDKDSLKSFISYGRNNENKMSDIISKIRQGRD